MKTLLLIPFVAIFFSSSAQIINIFHNGTLRQHRVSAISDQGIFTEIGIVRNEQIDSIQIIKEGPYSNTLKKKYGDTDWKLKLPTPKMQEAGAYKTNDMSGVMNSLEQFRIQRQAGKGLQMAGILATVGGLTLQSIYNHQYKKEFEDYLSTGTMNGKVPVAKYVPSGVFIGAGAASFIGFVIDLDAGRHLRFLKH